MRFPLVQRRCPPCSVARTCRLSRCARARGAGTHAEVGAQIGTRRPRPSVRRRGGGRLPRGSPRRAYREVDGRASCRGWSRSSTAWPTRPGADPMARVRGVDRGDLADAAGPAGRCSDLVGCGRRRRRRAPLGGAQQRSRAGGRAGRLVALEWRVPGDPVVVHDRHRAVDQRRLQLGRPRPHRERGLAERQPDRHPPAAATCATSCAGGRSSEAVEAALNPHRASSYNTILSHRDGGVVNVEGSATDAELIRPGPDGTLAHTNHYVSARMLPYEGDPEYAAGSAVRYRRALEWLAPGQITAAHPAARAPGPHRGAALAVPPHRARRAVEDCLLVPCRRHRGCGHIRPRKPLRLSRAAVCLRLIPRHPPAAMPS